MASPSILALDVADSTGWARSSGDYGTWALSTGKSHGEKLWLLDGFIRVEYERERFDIVAMEAPIIYPGHESGSVWKIQQCGQVKFTAYALATVRVREYNPRAMKAWMTGSGRASKAQMIRAVKTHFGLIVSDDNQADAICVLEMARAGVPHNATGASTRLVRRKLRDKTKRLFK